MAKIRQRDLPFLALLIVGSLVLIIGIFALPLYAIYCLFSGKPMFDEAKPEDDSEDNALKGSNTDSAPEKNEEPLVMTREAARARLRAKGFVFHDE
ncbi:hypothetical protein [Marinobacter sp. VGCF2001]|uniref:hypothetical protein n=1 Tax=Marinobacter sp. VGCF2001 TaxID=3417189 RepID=UPI003CEF35FB